VRTYNHQQCGLDGCLTFPVLIATIAFVYRADTLSSMLLFVLQFVHGHFSSRSSSRSLLAFNYSNPLSLPRTLHLPFSVTFLGALIGSFLWFGVAVLFDWCWGGLVIVPLFFSHWLFAYLALGFPSAISLYPVN